MALTAKKREAIELLVSSPGMQKQEIAAEVGIDKTTLSRWMKNEEFMNEWTKAADKVWAQAVNEAKKTVQELLNSRQDAIRLGAAKLLIDKTMPTKTEIESDGGINIRVTINGDK